MCLNIQNVILKPHGYLVPFKINPSYFVSVCYLTRAAAPVPRMTFWFLMWMSSIWLLVAFGLRLLKMYTHVVYPRSQVFSIDAAQDVRFVFFVFLIFLIEFSPRTTNNTHFHFGCLVFPLRCPSHISSIFCFHVTVPPISICNSFLDISWSSSPRPPHLCCVHFLSFEWLFSLFSLSLVSPPCMPSSLLSDPNQYLFSFPLCRVCSWLFAVCN